jgi:hypothetical protein
LCWFDEVVCSQSNCVRKQRDLVRNWCGWLIQLVCYGVISWRMVTFMAGDWLVYGTCRIACIQHWPRSFSTIYRAAEARIVHSIYEHTCVICCVSSILRYRAHLRFKGSLTSVYFRAMRFVACTIQKKMNAASWASMCLICDDCSATRASLL